MATSTDSTSPTRKANIITIGPAFARPPNWTMAGRGGYRISPRYLPALAPEQPVNSWNGQHGALAVSLNAFANLVWHARKGHMLWRCAIVFSIFGMTGAFVGSTLGKLIDGDALLFNWPRKLQPGDSPPITRRSCYRAAAMAVLTGAASGFFGIGGGFLFVLALIFATGICHLSDYYPPRRSDHMLPAPNR